MTPAQRKKARARRWAGLSPAARKALMDKRFHRREKWLSMTPRQRRAIVRARWAKFTPEHKQALMVRRKKLRAQWHKMTPQQKQQNREKRWAKFTPEQRSKLMEKEKTAKINLRFTHAPKKKPGVNTQKMKLGEAAKRVRFVRQHGPLPLGWHQGLTAEGLSYYWNDSGAKQLHLPTVPYTKRLLNANVTPKQFKAAADRILAINGWGKDLGAKQNPPENVVKLVQPIKPKRQQQ